MFTPESIPQARLSRSPPFCCNQFPPCNHGFPHKYVSPPFFFGAVIPLRHWLVLLQCWIIRRKEHAHSSLLPLIPLPQLLISQWLRRPPLPSCPMWCSTPMLCLGTMAYSGGTNAHRTTQRRASSGPKVGFPPPPVPDTTAHARFRPTNRGLQIASQEDEPHCWKSPRLGREPRQELGDRGLL